MKIGVKMSFRSKKYFLYVFPASVEDIDNMICTSDVPKLNYHFIRYLCFSIKHPLYRYYFIKVLVLFTPPHLSNITHYNLSYPPVQNYVSPNLLNSQRATVDPFLYFLGGQGIFRERSPVNSICHIDLVYII